ncbi:hypothetical protein AgCh_004294 [Apium graveolens]
MLGARLQFGEDRFYNPARARRDHLSRAHSDVMNFSDDDTEKENGGDDENQVLVVDTRSACDNDFSDSEDSDSEHETCLMERVGLGKGAMCELTREHCVVVMEERTVAEDLDNYLTGVQRRRQHRYELEERRIRDDAEAKRREDEKRRQEKEVSALTRADGEEKTASSGSFLKAAESALKLKERRSQIYKQVVAETEALRRSVDLRSHELQIARRIRQISWTTESVRGKAIELVTLITNSTYPRSSTLIFAEKIVSQCANPSGSLSKSVFAYAQVIFLVTSQVPQAMDFVLADFVLAESNRLCIYTVPMHEYSESIFKTKEAYYKAIEYC